MKKIPNAQTNLEPVKSGGEPPCFVDLLKSALDYSPNGFPLPLIRKRQRVFAALESVKPGGEIKLEDADYETAQQAIREVVWVRPHAAYVQFADAFGVV